MSFRTLTLKIDNLNTIQELDSLQICEAFKCNIQEIDQYISSSTHNNLIVITQNIRSIYRNFDDLQVTLSQLNYEVDILILTECRLDSNKQLPLLNNYTSFQSYSMLNQNDGVVIYIKNQHTAKITELSLTNATGLQIELYNFVFLAIYRSPSYHYADGFINSLNAHLEKISHFKNIIVIGDININLISTEKEKTHERRNRLNYLNVLSLHGLLTGHTLSTREDSCLDHIILKLDTSLNFASVAVINTTITDHNLVLVKFSNVYTNTTRRNCKTVVDFEKAYNTLIASDVSLLNIYNDPEIFANSFIGIIKAAIETNSKIITVSSSKRTLKPWITSGALKCIQLRNSMHIKLRKEPNNAILKVTYKRYRNFCSNLIKKLKRNYNSQKINRSANNPKKLWSAINDVTQYKPPKTKNVDLLNIKPQPQESVNYVNNIFVNVGPNLADSIIKQSKPNDQNLKAPSSGTTSHTHPSSFVLLETNPEEVDGILMSLDSSSATGWDGISIAFLKRARDFVVPYICQLANLCFSTGVFPKALKRSIVTPVYKNGDKSDVYNFRPISVLTAISKIIEKIINNRLINFLSKYNIISQSQYGFRKKLSTEDAILDLISTITKEVDKGNKCLAVFLDLKKAFDTVSLAGLINKLESIGIRGNELSLFVSYLSDRTQAVKIDSFISDEETVTFGVPQGSVLGPTLFLIYVNELCNLQDVGGRIISYADDTAIVFVNKTWDSVYCRATEGLAHVSNWLTDNLLTLNIQKTNYICFAPYTSSQPKNNLTIKIHNCSDSNNIPCNCPSIEKVSQIKYLGVIVDQRLNWHLQLEAVISRLRKLVWVFKSLRTVMTNNLLNKIYIALAQSVICYCIPIWGGATKTDFLDLERAQRSLLKVMYLKPYEFPTNTLYQISNLLSVRKLYILNLILKFHKTVPFNESTRKKRRSDIVATSPYVRTVFARRQYVSQSIFIYNKLNKILKIYPMQLYTCKQILKQWLRSLTYNEVEGLLTRIV